MFKNTSLSQLSCHMAGWSSLLTFRKLVDSFSLSNIFTCFTGACEECVCVLVEGPVEVHV